RGVELLGEDAGAAPAPALSAVFADSGPDPVLSLPVPHQAPAHAPRRPLSQRTRGTRGGERWPTAAGLRPRRPRQERAGRGKRTVPVLLVLLLVVVVVEPARLSGRCQV